MRAPDTVQYTHANGFVNINDIKKHFTNIYDNGVSCLFLYINIIKNIIVKL